MVKKKIEKTIVINKQGKPSAHILRLNKKNSASLDDHAKIATALFAQHTEQKSSAKHSIDFIAGSREQNGNRQIPVRRLSVFVIAMGCIVFAFFAVREVTSFQYRAGRVLGAVKYGAAHLQEGSEKSATQDFARAYLSFTLAEESFKHALTELDAIEKETSAFARAVPQNIAARFIVRTGHDLSEIGRLTAQTGALLSTASTAGNSPFALVSQHIKIIHKKLSSVDAKLQYIPSILVPDEYRPQFQTLRVRVSDSAKNLSLITGGVDFLFDIFGGKEKKRYLVFFQNDAEMRATGGFWGSFAILDFDNGALKHIEIPPQGTYALQRDFTKRLSPPLPFGYLRDRWEFQDANWYFDFPTSAKQAIDFYTHAGGSSIDGVIALNASMLPKLLELTGPLELTNHQMTLTAQNALLELQKNIDLRDDKSAPKAILGEAGPLILKKLFQLKGEENLRFVLIFLDALNDGSIQLYFMETSLAERAREFGWDGAIVEQGGDYLAIVDTNIAGGKTDAVIEEKIDHSITVLDEGSLIHETIIFRRHTGKSDQGPFIGTKNRDFMRLYFSPNTRAVEVRGFERAPDLAWFLEENAVTPDGFLWDDEIKAYRGTESGKAIVAGWVLLEPGEEKTVFVRSVSPKGFDDAASRRVLSKASRYRFDFQPQSGQRDAPLNIKVRFSEGIARGSAAVSGGILQVSPAGYDIAGNAKYPLKFIVTASAAEKH